MRPLKTLYRLLLTVSLLALTGCGERLPKPTQEGRNIFACKINGKKWQPSGGGAFSGIKPIRGGYYLIEETPKKVRGIWIRARRDQEELHIHLSRVALGEHTLNQDTQVKPIALYADHYVYYKNAVGRSFVTSSKYQGKVNITRCDTVPPAIISGTFELTAGNSQRESVRITEGRFDIISPQ